MRGPPDAVLLAPQAARSLSPRAPHALTTLASKGRSPDSRLMVDWLTPYDLAGSAVPRPQRELHSLLPLMRGRVRGEPPNLTPRGCGSGSASFRTPSGYATATLAPSKGRLMRCTVDGFTPNRSAMTRTPGRPGVARAARIDFLQRRGYRRPTKSLPLAPGPRKPGADAFLDHGALELGKYAHHLKHRLACRRRGVEPLLAQE